MSYVDRNALEALIPQDEVQAIFQGVAETSSVFKLFQRLPNMSTKTTKLKVLDALPVVYWQSSDTARKKITKQAWKGKEIVAEELAVIIPIAEAALDDANYDLWGEIKPRLIEAIASKFDAAVFLGEDKPSSYPAGLLVQAQEKGLIVAEDGSKTFYKLVSEALGLVEELGFDATGIVGGPSLKKAFRDMTDTTGQLIVGSEISSLPREVIKNGAWDKSKATLLVGDFKQAVFSIRQDATFKIFAEGVIQDPSDGSIVYNLMQDDMVAIRVVFRAGWQLPNPVSALATNGDLRLPFAVVVPSAGKVKAKVALTPGVATAFDVSQVVSIKATPTDAKIYYTNDGTTPSAASTLYSGPITLTATKTVKAIAIRDNYTNSDVASVVFTKN